MKFNLQHIRNRVGMTQQELAEKSGVSRVTISRLETGELKETNTGTLMKLARVLNVSISELVDAS